MTRFARAKGSKASNERLPEQPTSWETMKKDLEKVQKEQKEKQERAKMNKIRQENYENFLGELTSNTKTEWAKICDESVHVNKKEKNEKNLQIKEKKKLKSSGKQETSKIIEDKSTTVKKNEKNNTMEVDKVIKQQKQLKQNNKSKIQKRKSQNLTSQTLEVENSALSKSIDKKEMSVDNQIDQENHLIEGNKSKKRKSKAKNLTNDTQDTQNSETQKNEIKADENVEQQNKRIKKRRNKSKILRDKNANLSVKQDMESCETLSKNTEYNVRNQERNVQTQQNNTKGQKRKIAKVRDNREHKRRKPELNEPQIVTINDKEEEIVKYDGFPIIKSDCERLNTLRRKLISKGVPRSEVHRTIALERRKSERYLSRQLKKNCFNCRGSGHLLSQCPKLKDENIQSVGTGICFKCGSTEHTHTKCNVKHDSYKFAQCFICKEQGHIARQCPDNPKGLYPDGGACKICGDVTHFKKDCPENIQKTQDTAVANIIANNNIECLDEEIVVKKQKKTLKNKIVKF